MCWQGQGERLGRLCVGACVVLVAALAAGQTSLPAGAVAVYSADFEKVVGPEWSARKTEVTPKGGRRFLGQFCNESVALTVKGLPPHKYLRISFELFVLLSWDGNYPADGPEPYGPDIWSLRVKGGPQLLHTTFAELPVPPSTRQAFPDEFPGPSHDRRTGAAETGTLGYVRRDLGAFDAVYRLSFVLAHTAGEVTFVFQASGMQFAADESWGLDNVKVEAIARARPLGAKELAALWERLGGAEPVRACGAIPSLVLAGDSAARFLGERLPRSALDERQVRRLLAQLDANEWKARESASTALRALGPAVAPRLREALGRTTSPEVRTRLVVLLEALAKADDPTLDPVRHHRVLRVLAAGRGPGCLRALRRLRDTAKGTRLQRRAEAALIRTAGEMMQPLLARARAQAAAGRRREAALSFREAHAIAREAGHGAADLLAQARQRLEADAAREGGLALIQGRLAETLAAEDARAGKLRTQAHAAPGAGKKRPHPLGHGDQLRIRTVRVPQPPGTW
jgi:hypothetical protein